MSRRLPMFALVLVVLVSFATGSLDAIGPEDFHGVCPIGFEPCPYSSEMNNCARDCGEVACAVEPDSDIACAWGCIWRCMDGPIFKDSPLFSAQPQYSPLFRPRS